MADAEAFRHDMVFKMNDYLSKAAADLNGVNSASNFMIADERVFAIVPPFRYRPPPLDEVLAGQTGNFTLLALWLGGAIALAALATRRLNPERA